MVGRPGRAVVKEQLPWLIKEFEPTFVIVNGENSASGVGITPSIANDLFSWGADVITLGNHAYHKKEIYGYLDEPGKNIVRPANVPPNNPGKGWLTIEKDGIRLAVANLCGRVYLPSYDDPFPLIDQILQEAGTDHFFLDFHAEATSEKLAMAFHLDGRITAQVGTHTHVQTADEQVLEKGTAYITDVGMCGPFPSVLGMDKDVILKKFLTSMPTKFEVADQPGVISGVVISVNRSTGRANAIERLARR